MFVTRVGASHTLTYPRTLTCCNRIEKYEYNGVVDENN